MDWLAFKARSIPLRRRDVVMSEAVRRKLGEYPAILKVRDCLSDAQDVKPWLSRRIVDGRVDHRADMMFNDWQISHFHLGDFFDRPDRVASSGPLLFAHIDADHATLLDVMPHGSWAAQSLLQTLLRTRPTAMEHCEMKGVVGLTSEKRTDKELAAARAGHVNSMMEIDGRFFMSPGLGIASSGHAVRFTRIVDSLFRTIADVSKQVTLGRLSPALSSLVAQNLGVPVRLGVSYSHDGVLRLREKARGRDLAVWRAIA